MKKGCASQRLPIPAFLFFALAAISPAYGQYAYSNIEVSGGTVWSTSALESSFFENYSVIAYVAAVLKDPNGNSLDSGYDEESLGENGCYDGSVYAEVDLEADTDGYGYYSVTAENWAYDWLIENWVYMGESYGGTYVSPPAPTPPSISGTYPQSGTYGEGDACCGGGDTYIEVFGSGFDPTGCACLTGSSFGTVEWVSDTQVNLYYDPGTLPDGYWIKLETSGPNASYSNSAPFTINGDPTPSFTVSPSLWPSGASTGVTLSGQGFGSSPNPTNLSLSDPTIGVSGFSGSDSQINFTASVPSGTPAEQVTVSFTSGGYNGFSFAPGPQGNSASGTAQVGICQGPTLQVAAQYQGGSTTVNAGGTVNITSAPEMPVISAFLTSSPGCSVNGTATYQLSTSYPGGSSAYSSGSIPANGVFSVQNSSFYGGSATVNWTYNGAAQPTFNFNILGQNPDAGTVQGALGGWPAVNISIHESALQEFVISPNGPGGNTPGFPMKDYANGFGLMALTAPAPTEDQKWNWQSNTKAGLALLQAKMNDAYTFLQGQKQQWNNWNSVHPDQQVAAAPDYWATSCCIFSLGSTGTMTYDQADGLKRYAGLGIGNPSAFLWLSNPSGGNPPAWQITPSNGVADDIVYQFATCSSVGSCQHSGTGCTRGSLGCPIQ